MVAHYAKVSGRQVDDLDYYLVLAKWKLAIVLEQGFQRAGDDEKLLAYGPIVVELMRSAADLAESSDYRGHARAPRSAGSTGRRRSCDRRERPSPPLEPGQVRVAGPRRGGELPDVLLIAERVPDQRAAAVRAGQRVRRRRRRSRRRQTVSPSATGDRNRDVRRVRRGGRRWRAGLARIPDGVDERTAAAFGVAHRTAYHTLRSVARAQAGDELIVLGAGGGVGLAAVQLGVRWAPRHRGRVVGRKARRGRALRRPAPRQPPRRRPARHAAEALPDGADAVIDPVGGDLSEPALRSSAAAAGS